ncbi:MAG: hypothetical protein NC131_08900 [Roseburia sp.]|nr:hypothetical protein [Roseburia sp.]
MQYLSENLICGHVDCHSNVSGKCIVLTNTDFGSKTCPFYKTHRQALEERRACAERLKASERIDLIERYYKSVAAFDMMLAQDKVELELLTGGVGKNEKAYN